MIPKIIHFCWLSGEPYPKNIQKCIDSWKEKLPDYEIILWDKNKFDINSVQWVKEAYSVKKYAFAADYIRFYALYNYGGIYLDSDVEVLKSFNNLLETKNFFCYEYTGLPEAAVVGSEKGQEWCKVAVDYYQNRKFINDDGTYNQVIAPLIMKYAIETTEKLKLLDDCKSHKLENFNIYTYDYFSPKNGFTGKIQKTENTYAIHQFNSAWMKKSFKIKAKKTVHLFLISVLGKKNYNRLLYKIRPNFKNNAKL